jgi:hypothetical protein
MNSDRRALALALVQQTVIEKNRCEITELLDCTVFVDFKEIEGDRLCIRLYNNNGSERIIIARKNIYMEITNDHASSFSYLESTMALFGVRARGRSLRILDNSNQFNFDMTIKGDNDYRLSSGNTWGSKYGMLAFVINKICKALYAFANRMPIE